MEQTKECLKLSILGERSAVKKYGLFAEKAEQEGKPNLAKLFRGLVAAERIHIKNHLSALCEEFGDDSCEQVEVGSSLENINYAIEGEVAEAKEMYPRFMKTVKKEGEDQFYKVALLSLEWAAKAEKIHAKILKIAQKSIHSGADFPCSGIYLCRVCGNLEIGSKPESHCVVCGHDEAFFQSVD